MSSELILIIVFIALSLLGGLADKAKKGGGHADGPAEGARRLPDGSVRVGGRTIPPNSPEAEAFWWLPAPATPEEISSEREVMVDGVYSLEPLEPREDVALERVETEAWRATAVAPRPEPVRVALEKPVVDRETEHQQFHSRYVEGEAPPAPRASRTLAAMRGRSALRRAIIASEVLGLPRSLRPPDER